MAERVFAVQFGSAVDHEELLGLIRPPAWHTDAGCKEAPAEVTWFPVAGDSGKAAKKVCGGCLVRAECLAWSLDQGPDLEGIWGGVSRNERARTRKAA
jgi:WhiB family redox-sensing transcriptional regulator